MDLLGCETDAGHEQERESFRIPDDIQSRIDQLKEYSFIDCNKCDCQFGSITCFKKRGYAFDATKHIIRGEDGNYLRSVKRECFKELTEDPPELKKGCWLTSMDFGNNRICNTKECISETGCYSCKRYNRFYGNVSIHEVNGMSFSQAVKTERMNLFLMNGYE